MKKPTILQRSADSINDHQQCRSVGAEKVTPSVVESATDAEIITPDLLPIDATVNILETDSFAEKYSTNLTFFETYSH